MARIYRFDKSRRRKYRGDAVMERASRMTKRAIKRERFAKLRFGIGWTLLAFAVAVAIGWLAAG